MSREIVQRLVLPPLVQRIMTALRAEGGRALLVGGLVRDLALRRPSKDLDFEVHGLTVERLEEILAQFGDVDLVGRQFGVFRIHGLDADFAVPRKDSRGRKPVVQHDPFMGIEEAARRRDLTINAMAVDPLEGTLLDPFGGMEDLEKGLLRAPDLEKFVEDPLRLFRVMRFVGVLEMKVDPALSAACRDMDLAGLARERIEEEFNKLFLEARRPSLGLKWLASLSRLEEILPEAAPLKGLAQDPKWHPEGDVWRHTLQTVDAAAGLLIGDRDQDLMLVWAALCHDLGKDGTTVFANGHIRSPGHTELSEDKAEALLSRMVSNLTVRKGAVKLCLHHLKPHDFCVNQAGPKAFKRLAQALSPETTLERLAALALADYQGRNPDGDEPLAISSGESEWFLEQARNLRVEKEPEKPVLMGRHLLDRMPPGPEMGRLLKAAYEIQISEGVVDVEELKARVLGEGT